MRKSLITFIIIHYYSFSILQYLIFHNFPLFSFLFFIFHSFSFSLLLHRLTSLSSDHRLSNTSLSSHTSLDIPSLFSGITPSQALPSLSSHFLPLQSFSPSSVLPPLFSGITSFPVLSSHSSPSLPFQSFPFSSVLPSLSSPPSPLTSSLVFFLSSFHPLLQPFLPSHLHPLLSSSYQLVPQPSFSPFY